MAGSIKLEIDETVVEKLVLDYFREILGDIELTPEDVKIEVKSKQNYNSEWELAAFKARVEKFI